MYVANFELHLTHQQRNTPRTMNTTIITLFTCEVLGTAAFHNGIKSSPCLDRKLMEMMKGFEIGNPMSIPMMDAWIKGWHGANLAKATNA